MQSTQRMHGQQRKAGMLTLMQPHTARCPTPGGFPPVRWLAALYSPLTWPAIRVTPSGSKGILPTGLRNREAYQPDNGVCVINITRTHARGGSVQMRVDLLMERRAAQPFLRLLLLHLGVGGVHCQLGHGVGAPEAHGREARHCQRGAFGDAHDFPPGGALFENPCHVGASNRLLGG